MPETITLPEEQTEEKTKRQPPYHVILLYDHDHSFHYVIHMLKVLFGHPEETGYQMAMEVQTKGRVIVYTTGLERTGLKQDQIHGFGPDPLIERCAGSMTEVIEPAE